MDTKPLERFAKWARRELISAVDAQASKVLANGSVPRTEHPEAVRRLDSEIEDHGRQHIIDKVAYTWFNRIIALRFMDVRGYTDAGVVSPVPGQEEGQPEILSDAKRGNFNPDVITSQRTEDAILGLIDGTRYSTDAEGEAYAILLTEYCRYWHRFLPFMFEREGDYTELLVPPNLLAEGAILSRAREVLTDEVCEDVEVIGWLYQFYISERKDEVFAGFKQNKKAGADEIPAATQLFTPHWIVRYLVENSVGRLWMLNHPESRLVDQMDYYIPPVEKENDFLKISTPEELTVIDPACGSGHMLTYTFDLLYAIYEEEGYAPSDIPGLILSKNLHGTEIDPRAGALAAFALTMKARAKQRTVFHREIRPQICVIEPLSFRRDEIALLTAEQNDDIIDKEFFNQFEQADTLGSLIQPSAQQMARLQSMLEKANVEEDLLYVDTMERAHKLVDQAAMLSNTYAVMIANPPYMGSANMRPDLSEWMNENYPCSKADLFAGFIERGIMFTLRGGYSALVTMQSWMFLGGFETLRDYLRIASPLVSMAHLGTGAFDSIVGEVVATTAFVLAPGRRSRNGTFIRLVGTPGSAAKAKVVRDVSAGRVRPFIASFDSFAKIPRSPIAYWVSESQAALYESGQLLSAVGAARKGIDTGENARFVRFWFEVSGDQLRLDPKETGLKWVPYNKGGPNLRWYGNRYWVVNWLDEGAEIKSMTSAPTKRSTIRNPDYFFREGFTYTTVSPGRFSARYTPANTIFDSGGGTYFAESNLMTYGALLNSEVAAQYFEFLAPTLNYQPGDVARIPVASGLEKLSLEGPAAVEAARQIWDSSEVSWDFQGFFNRGDSVKRWVKQQRDSITCLRKSIAEIEFRNDQTIAEVYGMALERTTPQDKIEVPSESESVKDLVSYAVGCLFGRYSLDQPGLILVNHGAKLQDYLAKVPEPTLIPDADNVIPFVDDGWFEDDIVEQFRQFLRVAFGAKHFEENLHFVEESLGVKTLRDYFIAKNGKSRFYEDHVKRYKKRPIYWMFSSPQGSFNALIYMHRYNPSTVSTVLNEYLREYRAKLEVALADSEKAAAGGSAKEQRESDRLRRILVELAEYEHDVLYPLATRQLLIDLDDGVLVNYLRFGRALKNIGLENNRKKVEGWDWPTNRLDPLS